MGPALRIAVEDDAGPMLAIYAPIVQQTATSFEMEAPSLEEFRRRITETLAHLPWLVCEGSGEIVGYAYAGPHRKREAYRWSAEVSVYIHESARRSGVGRALYTLLLEALRLQGFYNA